MTRYSIAAAVLALIASAVPLGAQGFRPSKPVEFLVHTGPGGGNDVLARAVSALIEKEKLLPVRTIVVNKTGGGGAVAAAHMVERRGDTHLVGFFTSIWIGAPLTSKESRVQFKELTPIAGLMSDPAVIVVKGDSPYKSLPEFIAAAKNSPGQLRQVGGSIESRDNLTRLILQRATGTNWAYIPFPAGGERVAGILGGHAQLYIADLGEVREYVRNGSMRVIAQLPEKRLSQLPDVPTVKQAGYSIPDIRSLRGVIGPPGIGKDVVEYWEGVFERMVKTDAWRRYLIDHQLEDSFMKSAQLAVEAEAFIAQRRQIYKEAGITVYR